MSFKETDTENSGSSLDEVSSLDDDFDAMCLESDDSNEEGTGDDMDSHTWNEIEPKSDAEFMEDYGLIEEVTSISAITQSILLIAIDISSRTKLLTS